MPKLLTCLAFLSLIVYSHAFAQDSGVEIDLNALENYTPPPMFEEETEALTPLPAVAPPPVEAIKTVNVPLPQRKPPFTGTLKKREIDIDEEQIVLQTAKDILKQIEGGKPESLQSLNNAAVQPPPQQLSPIKTTVKNEAILSSSKPVIVPLPFTVSDVSLSEEQKLILLEQIFIRLQKYEGAHVEVRAYASSEVAQESPARRISLERALAIQDFLTSKGIEKERIYLRPLGTPEQGNADYVELVISRL